MTAEIKPAARNAVDPGARQGCLIVNADDWGRDKATTDRTLECFDRGALSSVSAMVFMEDSERAARVAIERHVDAGLHWNFTTPFSGQGLPAELAFHLERTARYLRGHRVAQAVFHPGLTQSFEYVARTQFDEYIRLYGHPPARIDGHHHMHLSANVLFQGLLPPSVTVRRNFSFLPGEKSLANRLYRGALDAWLGRSHPMTDYFFSLPPLEPQRLRRFAAMSQVAVVEVETHPINPDEYRLLCETEPARWCGTDTAVAPCYRTGGACRESLF